MFIGVNNHTVDIKGRLIVPHKFREELGFEFVVTRGMDKCLVAYPKSEWEKFAKKVNKLPILSDSARGFVRFFFSEAAYCETDRQGRIMIPQNLREYAGIDKDIVIAGAISKIEIWNKNDWEETTSNESIDKDEIMGMMQEFGIRI